MTTRLQSDSLSFLARDFRDQLYRFYSWSNLAPPYHTIELAVRALIATLDSKTHDECTTLIDNPDKKWALYQELFVAAGLGRKHRGILAALARTNAATADSPSDYRAFLKVFRPSSSPDR